MNESDQTKISYKEKTDLSLLKQERNQTIHSSISTESVYDHVERGEGTHRKARFETSSAVT